MRQTLIDTTNSNEIYIGIAAAGVSTSAPFWSIQQINISGTIVSILTADGDTFFDNIWDDRTSLNYE